MIEMSIAQSAIGLNMAITPNKGSKNMKQDWNPLNSTRDLVDFAKGMDQHRATQETAATRKLLEEQVRLQKEANELEKKRQELERTGQAQSPTASTTAPYNKLSPEAARNAQANREYKTAIENVVNERDTERRREMARKFEAKYCHSPFERPNPKEHVKRRNIMLLRIHKERYGQPETPSERQQREELERHWDDLFEKDRLRREEEIKKNAIKTLRKAEYELMIAKRSGGNWWSFITNWFGGHKKTDTPKDTALRIIRNTRNVEEKKRLLKDFEDVYGQVNISMRKWIGVDPKLR